MDLQLQIEEWSKEAERTFIIYGSHEALFLFDESLKILIASDCFDYHIAKYSIYQYPIRLLTGLFPIDAFRVINEDEYNQLHRSICEELRVQMNKSNVEM